MSLDMIHRSVLASGLKIYRPLQSILLGDSQEEELSIKEKKLKDGVTKPIVARTAWDPAITEPNYDPLPILGSRKQWQTNGVK